MAATPFDESPRGYSPAPSAGETSFNGNLAPKVMRIRRVVKGKLQVEIIRDPQVIASYRRRVEDRKIEEFRNQADVLVPTGNQEEDELRKAA
jgi:uridine kinase